MRNEFAKTLTELAEHNKDLVLLTGDIGNKLFDNFKEKYPDRFYNCGVAEANMTGVASGLASSGLRPITYTITPFNTARCFEQIRLDVCYPNLPVIIVSPSQLKAQEKISSVCPSKTPNSSPVSASQTRADLSLEPVNIFVPDGLNETFETSPSCLESIDVHEPVLTL